MSLAGRRGQNGGVVFRELRARLQAVQCGYLLGVVRLGKTILIKKNSTKQFFIRKILRNQISNY